MKLEIKHIQKSYAQTMVLNECSFTLTPGVYGLLGANGAGKSTLFKIICGLTKADSGNIYYNGNAISESQNKFNPILGFLPQKIAFYPEFTGLDFLLYIATLKGIDRQSAKEKCLALLTTVGLIDVQHKKIRKYSGGMQQRLGIAQAMLNDPEILILDEPTVGLDPKERVKFRNLISSFSDEKIVILSTHIVSDVEYIADEILILQKGGIQDSGTPPELVQKIAEQVWECSVPHDLVAKLLATYTISNQKHEKNNVILRIIAEKKPLENAVQVTPTLEDLYLYYFREAVHYD